MAITITDAERLTYRDNFMMRVQEMGQTLWPIFPSESVEGLMKRIDFIGPIAATQIANNRFTPIVGVDPLHTNRWLTTNPNEQAVFVDKKDIKRVVMDPKARYMDELVNAFVRRREDVIISSLGGVVTTGESGGSTQAFDTANQEIAAGGQDLTLEKLQDTLFTHETRAFTHQKPGMRKFFVYTPAQKRSLLRTTQVTSSDFNIVKTLVSGDVGEYMGYTFLTSTLLTSADGLGIGLSVNRECYAFTMDAILKGEGMDRITDVRERYDLTKFPWQLYVLEDIGAVRMQEELVVRVICDETAG